jgi:hypothetical protein
VVKYFFTIQCLKKLIIITSLVYLYDYPVVVWLEVIVINIGVLIIAVRKILVDKVEVLRSIFN